MAGFEYRGQLNGAENPVVLTVPIVGSGTVKVGDAVRNAPGATRITSTTSNVLGVVIGIVDKYGIDLDNTDPTNYDGTWTSSSKTYVAAADNMTDKMVAAQVIADPNALFYNDADGDFTNPADNFLFVKCTDHDQIDEDTTSATVGHFFIVKLDPDGDGDASKCIVKIGLSQLYPFEPET